jgi:hypothetical protein
VSGFLVLEPENTSLCLNREDWNNGVTSNSIGISLTSLMQSEKQALNYKYVLILAKFRSNKSNPLEQRGYLFDVEHLDFWSDPDSPRFHLLQHSNMR